MSLDEVSSQVIVMTISEFIEKLAGQPPMMLMFCFDEDEKEFKFINDIEMREDGGIPLMCIKTGHKPKILIENQGTHEEQVDEKREYAMELTHKSQEAMRFPRKVE
jgi:hypothetical protein